MNKHSENWEKFLNPEILRERIISASMFLIANEILIESIVGRIKFFYLDGFNENGSGVNEDYTKEVLALNKSPVYASLEWLKSHEVINDADLEKFERVKVVRNSLAHELSSLVARGTDFNPTKTFDEVLELIKKIEVWWIVNFELALNSDFDGKEIDEDGIVPGPILSIQMMLKVLSGDEDLLNYYKEISKNRAQ